MDSNICKHINRRPSTMKREMAATAISRFVVKRMRYHKQRYSEEFRYEGYTFNDYLWDIRGYLRDEMESAGPLCVGCLREITDLSLYNLSFCSIECMESEKDPFPEPVCRGCNKYIKTKTHREYSTCSQKCLIQYIRRVRYRDYEEW